MATEKIFQQCPLQPPSSKHLGGMSHVAKFTPGHHLLCSSSLLNDFRGHIVDRHHTRRPRSISGLDVNSTNFRRLTHQWVANQGYHEIVLLHLSLLLSPFFLHVLHSIEADHIDLLRDHVQMVVTSNTSEQDTCLSKTRSDG